MNGSDLRQHCDRPPPKHRATAKLGDLAVICTSKRGDGGITLAERGDLAVAPRFRRRRRSSISSPGLPSPDL
ncbi:UNVERIFIED_CONTAM: hypothetical protein Slati_3694000 [Sesamum latifolium]|uniref:Uncharacterized protein n=1 Tax=Sesamum latifolium TaxID=2727402 RepID=A0AAW2U204_9LAMI